MNKINILFNTNKYYFDDFLNELQAKISNIIFSSSELLVYKLNNIEVVINNLGTVSFNPIDENKNIGDLIPIIINEYNNLTKISNRFDTTSNFKIISPKHNTPEIVEMLNSLNYNTMIRDVNDYHTLTVN